MEEDSLDIIKKIQESRSPKYFLYNIIKDLEWFTSKNYEGWLIGKKDDIIYFNYNKENHTIQYSYIEIYQILKTKYHLNVVEVNELVGGMVCEHFKIMVDIAKAENIYPLIFF
jgi:hypothetical protein